MLIRPECPSDLAAIYAVHQASFPTPAEACLVGRLRDAGRLAVSLVAEFDGTIVGHIGSSPVTAGEKRVGAGLAPVAVLPPYRRQGIAAELVRQGLAACRTARFEWAVVLGEPEYYGRFGFRPAAEFGLVDEYGGGDAFQAIELVALSMPRGAGIVRYAQEFAGLV